MQRFKGLYRQLEELQALTAQLRNLSSLGVEQCEQK